jgi:TonB family protein
MLRILISSQPARTGWIGSTTFSTVTHGALIALAVAGTAHGVKSVREERATDPERITYIETRMLPARPTEKRVERNAAPSKPSAPPALDLAMIAMQVTDAISAIPIPDIAAPDLTEVTNGWTSVPDSSFSTGADLAALLMAKLAMQRPANGIFTEEMVERSVRPRRGNPTPRYPSALEGMGIEGDFVVKFVVDSTGAVKDDQIEFPSSMHRLFVDAVRNALRRSRYFPATFAGRTVPQLVVQEFRFTMHHGR